MAIWWILLWAALPGRAEDINVSLRVDRTVTTSSANKVDFGGRDLPESLGQVILGRTPGGLPITVTRVSEGYAVRVAGTTATIPPGGSIAVEAGGLPYVALNEDRALLWIPHYQAEGVLTVGPCRERIAIFDANANGRFDDPVGIDLFHDGRLLFGRSFEFCGRMLTLERLAGDGASVTFRQSSPLVAEVDQAAPDLTLSTVDSGIVKPAQRRLKPLVLDFWASWCDVCLSEFPAIRKLHESGSVEIVSVNVDEPAQAGAARAILRQQKPEWAQVLTGQGMATSAWLVFAPLTYSGGMPLYALIGRDGVLRYAGTGGGSQLPELKAALEKLP